MLTAIAYHYALVLSVDRTREYLYLFIYLFIYFNFIYFLAALGFHCCARAFSSCDGRELLFVAVCRLLIVVSSLVVEHGL